jgi:hypothetical protein
MGIVGGAVGERRGGILMNIGGIFAIIGGGLFGVLSLVLLIVGGILAIKESSVKARASRYWVQLQYPLTKK